MIPYRSMGEATQVATLLAEDIVCADDVPIEENTRQTGPLSEPLPLEVFEDKVQSGIMQVVLKCGDTFLIADPCGDFLASRSEMGLFRHGTRFLRTCNLYLQGRSLVALSHQVAHPGNACHSDLTNTPFTTGDGNLVEQGTIHIARLLELEQDYLVQGITLTSFYAGTVSVVMSLEIGADFSDLFEVRGWKREQRGELLPDEYNQQEMFLGYRGLDRVERLTHVHLEPATPYVQDGRVDWVLDLECGEPVQVCIKVAMGESDKEQLVTEPAVTLWREHEHQPGITSDDPFFNRLLTQGMRDIMMLSTMTPHGYYPYAGIPWYSCPFGRDGLIAALEFLPFYPQVARGTLAFLAAYQGKKVEPFTDEEPGKILHEFRTGEMAHCGEIPYIPYYGTVDATPLFLITLEAYMRWTNDLTFLEQLWPNAEAAAHWLLTYGDKDGDTFIEYHTASEKGLSNQGWKDAWDAISYSDGNIARSPLALCEVQGYAYGAYRAMSQLARMLGKDYEAAYWDRAANRLRTNFLHRFWWEEEQVFYQGLNEHKQACDVVSSNAGQCLWTGIVPEDMAHQMIDRLMREDMFSGWGMRTLSTGARRYNPMSYHNGSIWPHDTALIGAGFARYGGKQEAAQLLKSLFDASTYFENARLPELYCGFVRREGYGPTRYPVSCSPQAWAAGAPFALLSGLLGLHPDAEQGCLTLDQPTLPPWLNTLEIRNISVGGRRVHLHFKRVGEHTCVEEGTENEVEIRVPQRMSVSLSK
ncbi:MAG TPA: glycogen debranching N-terminal domain-containing protein [Ktedonobacteraceae bacterium]|nr:glycogen debranching N-terminal domain-containing protein [Ktedonobacteraceae bacterium]